MPDVPPFGPQPRLLPRDESSVADHVARPVEDRRVVAAVVGQRAKSWKMISLSYGNASGGMQVAPSDLDAVDPQFARRDVEQALDDEDAVLPARAAVRGDEWSCW